ncbi:MAG: TfoX/Sxy family protein [Fimbriimonadaceae bacterium]
MPNDKAQIEAWVAQMSAHTPVRTRAMFGGHGFYAGDLFFALADDNQLYFKVDDSNRAAFEAHGMEPFVPWPGAAPMGYYPVPQVILDNPPELGAWMDAAIAVAEANKRPSRPRKQKV